MGRRTPSLQRFAGIVSTAFLLVVLGCREDSPSPPTPTPTPFSVTISQPDGNTTGPLGNARFTATGTGTYRCYIDGNEEPACEPGTDVQFILGNGVHTFNVVGTETATGSVVQATVDWPVDAVGPVVTITSPMEGGMTGTSGTITFTSNDSNGSRYTCDLDGAAVACDPTAGFPFVSIGVGAHTVEIRGFDRFNNAGAAATVNFTAN